MKLNIKELLDFFDNKKESDKGDANGLMSILGEDLNASVFRHFMNNNVEILECSVVTGSKKGKWLDRWIVDNKNKIIYQCEIKNWAATSKGGQSLKVEASDVDIEKISLKNKETQIRDNFSNNNIHPTRVTKVLLKMRTPKEYINFEIKPLVIYWMPISFSKNNLKPLSTVTLKSLGLSSMDTEFKELQIFSVSLYLRSLYRQGKGEKIIELDLPNFERRMKIIKKFLK